MIKKIKKSDGRLEDFDPNKLNKWAEWAALYKRISWSNITLKAYRACYDKCSTTDLHKALITACIEEQDEDHLKMAGRLFISSIYKEVYGGIDKIPSLIDFYKKMVKLDFWVKMDYSEEELHAIGKIIDHSKDMTYTYSELKALRDKNMIVDKTVDKCYESPQMMYIGVSMAIMEKMPKERRINDIIEYYKLLSDKKLNAPTPFLCNARTKHRDYASCNLYSTLDTSQSLAVGDHIAYLMTCASAGIGAHLKTRSKGDKVRKGTIEHLGKIPYYRCIESAVRANKQSSRGGSATVYYNVLDPEVMSLLMLKSIVTPVQEQVRGLDYSFGYNKTFARKVAFNEDWMLVSYKDAPELHEALYSDDLQNFEKLYEEVLNNKNIKKTIIKARDIVKLQLVQSYETGRIYLHETYEMNHHTPFKEKIYMSNLCVEICQPTKGFKNMQELYSSEYVEGEISVCSLSAIVAGRVKPEEYYNVAYYTLLGIDNVIELMNYPFPNLETTAKARRNVGVGITNLAYDLAKRGLTYNSIEGKNYIHQLAELHSYSLTKASLQLAKERGVCDWMHKTKYPQGWLPIDTYNKNVDKVHTQELLCDWESLRKEIIENGGIRNSVLEANMPCESCNKFDNKIQTVDYGNIDFHEICEINGIDYKKLESEDTQKWLDLKNPLKVYTKEGILEADKLYYNGNCEVFEIEFEDGNIYSFTGNHKLLISIENEEKWVKVSELTGDEEILCLNHE